MTGEDVECGKAEFGPEQGKFMLVVRELYVLRSYGASFRGLLD